jgi:hypothetical protein
MLVSPQKIYPMTTQGPVDWQVLQYQQYKEYP